jgi:hypothetical protein
MLSVDALHASETLASVADETLSEPGVEGACVSLGGGGAEHAAVATLTCARCDVFPAASRAWTPKAYEVAHVSPVTLALVPLGELTLTPSRKTS